MSRKIKYGIYGLVFWFLLFLVWEWVKSYPKVRWEPLASPQNLNEKIDSILIQSLSDYLIPGIAVGIVHDGKTIYLNAFGYQNMESKDTLTLKSQIPVASISKLFTALAVANYFSSEGIASSATLEDLLSEEKNLPESLKKTSLGNLLNHNSGLKDSGSLEFILKTNSQRSLETILHQIKDPSLPPGEFHYADINFDLLGFVLQRHSQKPFEDLINEITLKKAGMSSSRFITSWPDNQTAISGYGKTFLWKRIEPKRINFAWVPSPSSGLVVTPNDLSIALIHFGRGHMGSFQKELNWLKSGEKESAGFQSIQLEGISFKGHFGAQAGYSSLFVFSEEWETGFFILTNAMDLSDHRKKIATSIIKQLKIKT
jgi:CubicO group peptidase (beta-lactamase class C family)